jgi:hypothetical protein
MVNHEVVIRQEFVGGVYATENGGKPTMAVRYCETVERPGVDFVDQSGVESKLRIKRDCVLYED